jgi:hypothetical protein
MRPLLSVLLASAAVLAACAHVATQPAGTDSETKAWWAITGDLSSDAMEGRDTGSAGYERAADYVERRLASAGLKPAGENGSWRQTVPLKEVRVETDGTRFDIARADGSRGALSFLHEISIRASRALPATLDAPLAFRGYCSAAEMGADMQGKVAVCFGGRRAGVPGAGERVKAAIDAGAVGLINVDDPGFTIEPARWPDAYARSISFRDEADAASDLAVMRLRSDKLAAVIEGSGQDATAILAAGAASKPLPTFAIPARLQAAFALSTRELASDNILALLPGTDPQLAKEIVIVSAHLDGYGYGEAVDGDTLYNGAFDDAAYVATLVRLAEQRAGQGFKRSVLFAVYTGEEKGLLGSTWFSEHLTVPKDDLAAVINLDQLRPLFPLKILTMHAIDMTSLKSNVDRVASGMGIEIRADMEPERNLIRRTDHWPFLRQNIPATNFVFGFDAGTEAERRYREWYQVRYHRPQDDVSQPIDFKAAADMNTFFYRLTEDVANDPVRPRMLDRE